MTLLSIIGRFANVYLAIKKEKIEGVLIKMSKVCFLAKMSIVSFLIYKFFFSLPAFAAGFQLNEFSAGIQGAATAGAAAAENDVSAMAANPATLSTLIENQIYGGASLIAPHVRMSEATATHTVNIPGFPPSSISAPVQGTSSQSSVSEWALVPDGFLGWRINDALVLGIALTSPFGLTTEYGKSSALRFAALKSSLITININPALALQLHDKLAIGFGLQFQYAKATFSNFDGAYTGIPAIDTFISANYPTKLHASGMGYGYNVGMLFIPCPGTRLGAGYRSRIVQNLSGHGRQYTFPGSTVPAPSHDFLFNANTSVNGAINTSAVLILSGAQDIQDWTLKASAQLNFWHSFKRLSINMPNAFAINSTIPAHWQDAWLLAAGADYRITPKWTLRAGTAYDTTPTRHQFRDPRIPDSNRFWLTTGFTLHANKNLSIDGAYEHIFGQNQNVNVTQASGRSATSTVPLEVNQVKARYKAFVDIFALAIRYSFC